MHSRVCTRPELKLAVKCLDGVTAIIIAPVVNEAMSHTVEEIPGGISGCNLRAWQEDLPSVINLPENGLLFLHLSPILNLNSKLDSE